MKFGIKGKINSIIVPALLPMLLIAVVSYMSHRNSSLESSERISKLIVEFDAKSMNEYLKARAETFQAWVSEDVYGMAVEFDTITELGGLLEEKVSEDPGFLMLALADKDGTILKGAVGEGYKGGSASGLEGKQSGVRSYAAGKGITVELVESPLLSGADSGIKKTYVFAYACKSMSGEHNGYVFALMDWSKIQDTVKGTAATQAGNGFRQASSAAIDPATGEILAHSDPSLIGTSIESGTSFSEWLDGAAAGSIEKFMFEEGARYVTAEKIEPPASYISGGKAGSDGFRLVSFVPENDIFAEVKSVRLFSIIITVAGAAVLLFVFWYMSMNITKPLQRIIGSLTGGADQMARASDQVKKSSDSLAQGSGQQAASLEQTSSSLEEMASMTRQNADNAEQANVLAKEARAAAEDGNDKTQKMLQSMEKIIESSNQTSKIIKTIDEIAFQTNLLALNAAVEAARAGEAGKGFAVVAEEVRNLAQRAGEAARSTATLIDDSMSNTNEGSKIADELAKSFVNILESSGKVSNLIAEIAASSKEQTQGIDQVNTAIGQMDQITQHNAGIAEETASAANEMNTQSDILNTTVLQLVEMVGGGAGEGSNQGNAPRHSGHNGDGHDRFLSAGADTPKSTAGTSRHAGGEDRTHGFRGGIPDNEERNRKEKHDPEEIIPFKEEEFKEF